MSKTTQIQVLVVPKGASSHRVEIRPKGDFQCPYLPAKLVKLPTGFSFSSSSQWRSSKEGSPYPEILLWTIFLTWQLTFQCWQSRWLLTHRLLCIETDGFKCNQYKFFFSEKEAFESHTKTHTLAYWDRLTFKCSQCKILSISEEID